MLSPGSLLKAVPLQAPVERAPAQAERVGRLADVAVEPRQGLLDQKRFHFFQAHILEPRRPFAARPQPQVGALIVSPCAISTARSTA